MNRGRPVGGVNGDGPFWPVSMATSPAAHLPRSVVIREIRVIRGQPVLAKFDDLSHHVLGATMAMLNVLILGNEQSEATTGVPERQSRNQRSDRDTKGRRDRAGDYGGDLGPRMEHGLNTERERTLTALEKEGSRRRSAGRPSRFIEVKYQGMVVGDSQLPLEGLFWESVFHPCSIRGSPENLVGNEGFLLIVVRIPRITTERRGCAAGDVAIDTGQNGSSPLAPPTGRARFISQKSRAPVLGDRARPTDAVNRGLAKSSLRLWASATLRWNRLR